MIADDEFIRMQFQAQDKASIADVHFVFTPPQTLAALIQINVRRVSGSVEMRSLYPEVSAQDAARQRRMLMRVARSPKFWPSLAVYVFARACTIALFAWKRSTGAEKRWARD